MERNNVVTMKGNPVTLVGPELKIGDKAPDFTVLDKGLSSKSLSDYTGKIKVLSVTPSLDTPVCDMQAKWFNDEAISLPGDVVVLNVSMDLPFAIGRFCAANGVDRVEVLSDHRDASFGESWGLLIKELRLLARAVAIVDDNDVLRYLQIVSEATDAPDYGPLMEALKSVVQG
ncbi:thiol peroxidase [Dethiosulfovibrio sp. F2B]|uniref:thiol peroxidase n=1 Tax=Dethiosulfovibrio faecalis TaxID=2720018 RepID=UPI001F35FE60|nr:thiol peroxidase [Dethiosulfovibrio faecalis]MCF4151830.1 thiol peroxidase [Dethiosulfovibrio faecalis]